MADLLLYLHDSDKHIDGPCFVVVTGFVAAAGFVVAAAAILLVVVVLALFSANVTAVVAALVAQSMFCWLLAVGACCFHSGFVSRGVGCRAGVGLGDSELSLSLRKTF